MAEINLAQTASVSTPAASTATLFIDNTATPLVKYTNPAAVTHTLGALGIANTWSAIQTLTTPVIGAATGTSLAVTGAITSSSATTGIGYATGAGGTVTQATSKVTAFTLSKMTGTITFAADALAADTTTAGATWTNTAIAATDMVVFTHISGGTLGAYQVACTPGAGSATIYLRNLTPGSLSEAPVFKFAVIKSVNA
jgi:hypothetical protein